MAQEFISGRFPFTRAELRVAFLGTGLTDEEADNAVNSFVLHLEQDDHGGSSFGEVGEFLEPIANLSDEAAERVRGFRAHWGAPQRGYFLE